MALNRAIVESTVIENASDVQRHNEVPLGSDISTPNSPSGVEKETTDSCTIFLEESQKMYLADADDNKFDITNRIGDICAGTEGPIDDMRCSSTGEDFKGIVEDQKALITTEAKEIGPLEVSLKAEALDTNYQHMYETDYCVKQDPDNATVFHIHWLPSDQNMTQLRYLSSTFYYGPELKSCSISLDDFRIKHRKSNPLENMEFFAKRPKWSTEEAKSKNLQQKVDPASADPNKFDSTNGSADEVRSVVNARSSNNQEEKKPSYSIEKLELIIEDVYDEPTNASSEAEETILPDAISNSQQCAPLCSDSDQCEPTYEVFQDPQDPLSFHVRMKITDSLALCDHDQYTTRRYHQPAISYYGPELTSCFIPLIDYRIKHRRNPLQNMEFFTSRPKPPKRKTKKRKSNRS